MDEDVAHGRGIGEESDDAHLDATSGTHEREYFLDVGENQRPSVMVGTTMRRFGGGFRVRCGAARSLLLARGR